VSEASFLPSTVRLAFPTFADQLDEGTGQLTGVFTCGTQGGISGTGAGIYSALSGAVVNWQTDTFINGRRLVGRTFIVPATGIDTDGSLSSAFQSALISAAANMLATLGGNSRVWHRPKPGSPGSAAPWTHISVPDKCVALRSRRD
jgi:hypothetical protein